MKLRKKEEDRLSELRQELLEEGSRCSLLSQQRRFNQVCCIRCCAPFTFLLRPARRCKDCGHRVCPACRSYSQTHRDWICTACQKTRLLRTQSLEWYYNNVKSRFKRFGSAKVLKTLYRKHIIERGALSELPESSVNEGSICGSVNDGSICGSDSAFYRQSEGHSMAETLTVALRVAEEAIEEAIAQAETFSDSLEKQNEARYLRDHREELIEELATTIVQKIIQRRKRSEMQGEYDLMWPQAQAQPQPSELPSPPQTPQAALAKAGRRSSYSLWRSRSAFSLTSDDSPEKPPEACGQEGEGAEPPLYAPLQREAKVPALPSWKSVDRLDNSSASSVLQSPDGNWLALQSSQLSRPGLLAKRKSLVFAALEKESGVVSAYDEMGSASASEPEDEGGWAAALMQFRRNLSTDETYYTDSQHDPEWTYSQQRPATSPSSGHFTNTETLNSDSETSSTPAARPRRPASHGLMRRNAPPDLHLHPHPQHQPSYHHHHHQQQQQQQQQQHHPHPVHHHPHPHHPEALDVNFNPKVTGDSSEAEEQRQQDPVRRSRRRRRSRKETGEPGKSGHPPGHRTTLQENSGFLLSALLKRSMSEDQQAAAVPAAKTPTPDAVTPEPDDPDTMAPNSAAPSPPRPVPSPFSPSSSGPGSGDTLEQEVQSKLSQMISRANSKELTSSEEEPIRAFAEGQQADRERVRQEEKQKPNKRERERKSQSERPRERSSLTETENPREIQANGSDPKERERAAESLPMAEEEGQEDRKVERWGESLEEERDESVKQKREENRDQRQHRSLQSREADEEAKRNEEQVEQECSTPPRSPALTPSLLEGALSDEQRVQNGSDLQHRLQLLTSLLQQQYSAASLCSITTEVLKVLNATEELIGEAGSPPSEPPDPHEVPPPPSSCDPRRLDQRLTKMEENVYLAAGAVYGLEGALGDLEESARSISSGTSDRDMAFLEDQVASAAAQVQQSELQISDIEARISALKTAGLDVSSSCTRFSKYKPKPLPQTLDSSRHQRRKLPAPPVKDKEQQPRAVWP